MIQAEIIADSINAATGDRLTTFKVRSPKWMLAEVNTHRALSRNWSSSRAVPGKKIRQMVLTDPFIPIHWGANQKGMQAESELKGWRKELARSLWLFARYPACVTHWLLSDVVGLHKQVCNRLLESWMWADGIISATEWNNFWKLRDHPDAQPEFQALAQLMHAKYKRSIPQKLSPGQWHMPLIHPDDLTSRGYLASTLEADLGQLSLAFQSEASTCLLRMSTARCARASYFLRNGQWSDWKADYELHDRLVGANPRHMSPTEHQAQALENSDRVGNFVGWKQYRKTFADESNGDYADR